MNLTHTRFIGNYAQYGSALCREINATGGFGVNNTFIANHAYIAGSALGWMGGVGIKITNYTFINNTVDISGGAIFVSETSHNCSIITSTFEGNHITNATDGVSVHTWTAFDGTPMEYDFTTAGVAVSVGGAINVRAANATVQSSSFKDNYARLGGGKYVGVDNGNTKINDSEFTSNHAYERGGAINLHASAVSVNNSKFYDNTADEKGGAMYVGGSGVTNYVENSLFDGNKALNGKGGAIEWFASEGHVDKTNFTNNLAAYGGVIYFNGESHNSSITNVRFEGNNATYNGGAIDWNAKQGRLYNTTFILNYAGEYGAALCREKGATRGSGENNTFISNYAGIAGAALAWMNVTGINIYDYHFIDNGAGQNGGAIYIADGSDYCVINYSYFNDNYVSNLTDGLGGAIDIVTDNASIVNSNFTQNTASKGGAVYIGSGSGRTNITNVTFTKNSATINGGAVDMRASGVLFNDTRFYFNTAGENGGAIRVSGNGTTNIVYNSTFEDNTAVDHGGVVCWLADAVEFTYVTFNRNSADYGGALYLNGVSTNNRLFYVVFENNTAIHNGGAIDCNATMMGLNNTKFISNTAAYGAALCRETNATGGFGRNNTFINNYATVSGAALAWLGVDGININEYTFINNTAIKSGGAIYVREDSPNCVVRNSYFDNNFVTDKNECKGGAIMWLGVNGTIFNTTFLNSYASNGGTILIGNDNMNITKSNFSFSVALTHAGAIGGHKSSNSIIGQCIFNHTVSSGFVDSSLTYYGEGGAIYWHDANNLTVSNSEFYTTESHSNGAAISLKNCNNTDLLNLTFLGQLTITQGGSISLVDSTNVTIDSSNFTDAAAARGGGALYLNNVDNVTVKNSNFNNTSSPWGNGGAIYVDGNVTINNNNFTAYDANMDNAKAIFFNGGNSTLANSSFNGNDAIWINQAATVYITANNITGSNPYKNTTFLETPYSKNNLVDYSVWNDGTLYLDDNNFDYVIFNNGTIMTPTTTYMLDNETWNVTWNTTFKFWANITDDNNNTIISVHTLDSYNNLYRNETYFMPYNYLSVPAIYQGKFVIYGNDTGLKQNTVHPGTLNVKMPTDIGSHLQ